MESQKIITLLYSMNNQLPKSRTKNWVEVNDNARGRYKRNSQIKFKTKMLNSHPCDYSDE